MPVDYLSERAPAIVSRHTRPSAILVQEAALELQRPKINRQLAEVCAGDGGVRVDAGKQLRYCIAQSVWSSGTGLNEWIDVAF